MIARLKSRLSFSNVVALLALMVALGGSAYAAAQITGADVVDGSLTGDDVADGSLKGVDIKDKSLALDDLAPNSVHSGKVVDDSLTGADINEDRLDLTAPAYTNVADRTDFRSQDPCPARTAVFCGERVEAQDQPWVNAGGEWAPAGFYKDREGVVHLRGAARTSPYASTSTVFVLPQGFRPGAREVFAVVRDPNGTPDGVDGCWSSNSNESQISVLPDGRVQLYAWCFSEWKPVRAAIWASLSGVEFRAEG